jgi:catechol 2,3-dioxygenase-like lactoylglutathione lyase family enzyme
MEIKGIQHVNINCTDLEKSQAFYELLGFKVWFPLDAESDIKGNTALVRALGINEWVPCKGLYMKLGDEPYEAYLDLLSWPEKSDEDVFDKGEPYDHARRNGIYRLCLWSRDFDGDIQRLKDAGVKFVGEPSNQMTKAGLSQVAAIYDPDGTVIEITNDWSRPKLDKYAAKGMFDGGETL